MGDCFVWICENCQGPMIAYRDDQRFCSRACSDQWFQEERRQAVEFFRALGMRPELRNGEQQKEA
jgi:hypothetical protein